MYNRAFTLIELIFTIVIIGVLASVALPKFTGLSNNSKIAAELSTVSSIQSALDACHGEWIINESSFTCGKSIDSSKLNTNGYPKIGELGDNENPLNKLLKNSTGAIWSIKNDDEYRGPASNDNADKSPASCKGSKPYTKPCKNTFWKYNATEGTFILTSE